MGYGDFKLFARLGRLAGLEGAAPGYPVLSAATGAVLGILMIALQGPRSPGPDALRAVFGRRRMARHDVRRWLLNGYMRHVGSKALGHGAPAAIGLTGGIASGKSTVHPTIRGTRRSGHRRGCGSREPWLQPGTPGLAHVVERFGAPSCADDGELDRRALRNLIFKDSIPAPGPGCHPPSLDSRRYGTRGCASAGALCSHGHSLAGGRRQRREPRGSRIGGRCRRNGANTASAWRATAVHVEQARAILASQASRAARLAAADDVLLELRKRRGIASGGRSIA